MRRPLKTGGNVKAIVLNLVNAGETLLANFGGEFSEIARIAVTLLIYASMFAPELVELLIAAGADVNARNDYGCTPLTCASTKGHVDTTLQLLKRGADTELGNEFGTTPLMFAAEKGHVEILKLLLANGANVAAENQSGLRALDYAASSGSAEAIQTLMRQGAKMGSAIKTILN